MTPLSASLFCLGLLFGSSAASLTVAYRLRRRRSLIRAAAWRIWKPFDEARAAAEKTQMLSLGQLSRPDSGTRRTA